MNIVNYLPNFQVLEALPIVSGIIGVGALLFIHREQLSLQARLLQAQAISAIKQDGRAPLHVAIERKDHELVKALIQKGVNLDEKNTSEETPLHLAVKLNDLDTMRLLIESGANVDSRAKDGGTPLLEAAKKGNAEAIQLLIEGGANPNLMTYQPLAFSPLHWAVSSQEIKAVEALLACPTIAIDRYDLYNPETPLVWAVSAGNSEMACYLIFKGAKVEDKLDLLVAFLGEKLLLETLSRRAAVMLYSKLALFAQAE